MATITYKVTVATGTTQYGTGNRFYINGELAPVLYLQEGNTYIFDQSDSSNAVGGVHQIAFLEIQIIVLLLLIHQVLHLQEHQEMQELKQHLNVAPVRTTGAPLLFYYCTNHSGYG